MKFKDINNQNEFYDFCRYNPNTVGESLKIEKSDYDEERYALGTLSIFTLINSSGFYREIEEKSEDKTPENIVNKMLESAKEKCDNYTESKGVTI